MICDSEVTTPAEYNGEECPTDLSRQIVCMPQDCPVDCVVHGGGRARPGGACSCYSSSQF